MSVLVSADGHAFFAEIAAASTQQAAGIEQVNRAVMQMDEMTQQNGGLVEQVSAASRSMAAQASELNELLEKYRVGPAAASTQKGARRGVRHDFATAA